MARTIEEIDAELAEVDKQIARRNAMGWKYAQAKAILDHDTSGIERIYSALESARQNQIARDAQQAFAVKQMEAQQKYQTDERLAREKYQTSEREAQQVFQSGENQKQRDLQASNQDYDRYMERARALRDLADARAVFDDTKKKYGVNTLDYAKARNSLMLQLENARHLGIDSEKLDTFDPEYKPKEKPKVPAGDLSGNGDGQLGEDQSVESTTNDIIAKINKATSTKEVDEIQSSLPFSNDANNTAYYQKVQKAADDRKKYLSGKERERELGRLADEYLNSLKKNSAATVSDLRKRNKAGNKTLLVPAEYGGGEASFEPVGSRSFKVTLRGKSIEIKDNH
jgi:hypothetical protein